MNERERPQRQTGDQCPERLLSARIRVCSAATALNHAVQERFYNYHFYSFQAGFLLPHRIIREKTEACYGGLNEEQTLFVLVPVELVQQRKQGCLRHIVREHLGIDDQDQLVAYCEQTEREMSGDQSHHSHPVFHAETQACKVAFWLGLLKQRQIQSSADWSW